MKPAIEPSGAARRDRSFPTPRAPRRALLSLVVMLLAPAARADGPQDNQPANVRPIPPAGIAVPDEVRQELQRGLDDLGRKIADMAMRDDPRIAALLPDVRIFPEAVRVALTHDEFFDPKEFDKARKLIAEGNARAEALARGASPWADARGLVVRGYVSKIDGSVQPYGLVVPESYTHRAAGRYRLDIWFHGRGEKLSELNFLDDRMRAPGQFAPADTIVLHPYGRYCNAFKFAGEVDVLEALDDVKARYRVDENRIAVRGFSMGGAACWQFAVHEPGRWFAANPGAGFAETRRFLELFQQEKLEPTAWEERLWHLYDCTDWAANLRGLPVVAYSGEIDRQKQAADVMAEAMREQGIRLTHIIGPKTAHSYHPDAAREVEARMAGLASRRPNGSAGRVNEFTTYTLRYNQSSWLTIDALAEHWRRGWVRAEWTGSANLDIQAEGVTELTITMPPGSMEPTDEIVIDIGGRRTSGGGSGGAHEGVRLTKAGASSDRSWSCRLSLREGRWVIDEPPPDGLRKRHGLQGPIDDAFMDAFLFVLPGGQGPHPAVNDWVKAESSRAAREWRRQFRGEPRVKHDAEITPADIARCNLVLWGDPSSNAILKRIAEQLPIGWDETKVAVGGRSFDAGHHVPVLIYPNPLNPERYVVVNSGFTYREYDYLNNARQVPKLPDWAVIDLRTPPDARFPGKVAAADFFDEAWRLRPDKP